jgi:hypothetical protein
LPTRKSPLTPESNFRGERPVNAKQSVRSRLKRWIDLVTALSSDPESAIAYFRSQR